MASVTATHTASSARSTVQAERLFYVIAAGAVLLLTAIGFRNFYLHAKAPWGDMTPQIVALVVTHGVAMTGWVLLFCLQSTLVLAGNRKLHMAIGPAGAVLAAAIVVLGSAVAIRSVHFNPALYGPFGGPRPFLMIMLSEMALFGAFVAIAIVYRRRLHVHRPMMLMATIVMVSGSLARTPYVENLAVMGPLYAYVPSLIFGALMFLLHWGMTRVASRSFLTGYAGMVATSVVAAALGNSAMWTRVTATLIP